jgi:hypothetical protein
MNHTHNEVGCKNCPACRAEAEERERVEVERAGQADEDEDDAGSE